MPKDTVRAARNTLHRRKFIAITVIGLLLVSPVISLPLKALAQTTADPGSTPTVTHILVDQNLAETGDILITGLYDIPYTTLPTLTADQTFIIRLMAADGTTELGSVTPFDFATFKNGYDQGVFSFYFPSGNALSWGTAYIIQIAENPAQFDTPLTWNTTIPSSAYTTLTTQADNQTNLASQVYTLGSILQSAYSQTLFTTSGTSETLTSIGEQYFRAVINGLQTMAPALFVIQQNNLNYTDDTWTTAAFDTYMERFNGTWVGDAMASTGNQFGMSGNMAMCLIFIVPLCVGCLIFSGMKFKTTDPGLVMASVALEMGAVMGWLPTALFAIILQLMAMYIGYLLFFARS
jgi:hypothetical protein